LKKGEYGFKEGAVFKTLFILLREGFGSPDAEDRGKRQFLTTRGMRFLCQRWVVSLFVL
jgi:hypothetical protein